MLHLRTEAVRLRQSDVPDLDGLRSFDFQRDLEEQLTGEETRAVFLSAETGAGKTRAFALPALKHRRNLIIVAPTNALIEDIRLNVERLRSQVAAPHVVHVVTRYALYALRGRAAPNRRATQGQALLRLLRDEAAPETPRILVTNPDSLAVALQALYYSSESILREVLHRFPWLVFDEFHAYAPKQIPSILFLHALADTFAGSVGRKTVFSSATPSGHFCEVLQRLLGLPASAFAQLSAEPSSDGFQVLQPTDLALVPGCGWDGTALRRYVADRIPDIRRHLTSVRDGEGDRRVCIIANSVFQASEIGDLLVRAGFKRGRDLEEIRGFLAPRERGRGQCPIVVGTSAIEMGVNFPISMLFTEGSEGASLIQRLGRLGRSPHARTAEAHALVPQAVYDELADLQGQTLPRSEFRSRVLEAYPGFETFWSYVQQFGLYENRFYIQRMEQMNTRHRHPAAPRRAPRQRAYLEETLLPRLARGYGVADWRAHLQRLDQEVEKRGRRARESLERILSSPRGETVAVPCAIFDRADLQRGLFPFKVYDARLLLSRGDIVRYDPWERCRQGSQERLRVPAWYARAAQKYGKPRADMWEEHWQHIESGGIMMFVELNGLTEDYRKVEYETRARLGSLSPGNLYALELRYHFGVLGLLEQADFSDALAGRGTLVVPLQHGRYQGALRQVRHLPPLFEVDTLHVGDGALQVAFGVNALYVWSETLGEPGTSGNAPVAGSEYRVQACGKGRKRGGYQAIYG